MCQAQVSHEHEVIAPRPNAVALASVNVEVSKIDDMDVDGATTQLSEASASTAPAVPPAARDEAGMAGLRFVMDRLRQMPGGGQAAADDVMAWVAARRATVSSAPPQGAAARAAAVALAASAPPAAALVGAVLARLRKEPGGLQTAAVFNWWAAAA